MRPFVGTSLVLAAAVAIACATRSSLPERQRIPEGDGLVLLYLEPLPPDAAGLRAEISSVAARGTDGTAHLLALESASLDATGTRRQRLLAFGPLPPGGYGAIEVGVARALLAAAPEDVSLAVPESPTSSAIPFRVEAGRSVVLRLRLEPGPAIGAGRSFEPVFTGDRTTSADLTPAAIAVASVPDLSALFTFHKRTGEVFDVLRTGRAPAGAVYDSERARAYAACAGPDAIDAFDLVRGVRDQSLPLLPGDDPAGIALSRDGRTLVVANPGSNTVTVLDAPSLAERFRITVGVEPIALLFTADDRRVFVFLHGASAVSVLDPTRGVILQTIPTEAGPRYGALARSGQRLLVIHDQSSYLSVIDVSTSRVVDRAYVGPAAAAIAVDPRNDRVYLARRQSSAIEVYDPAALLPVETIETAGDVTFLAMDRESDQLLAAIPTERAIRVFRLVGTRIEATVESGAGPDWIDLGTGRSGS